VSSVSNSTHHRWHHPAWHHAVRMAWSYMLLLRIRVTAKGKFMPKHILILLESWHGGRYPSRLSWNSTVSTDNSRCNYINQVAVCTPDKMSLNKKQCPPYAYSARHSKFPPTVIFTTSFNSILSRLGVCVFVCVWRRHFAYGCLAVCQSSLSRNVQ